VALEAIDVVAYQTTAMCREPTLHDPQRTVELSNQSLQELDRLRALDRTRIEPEVETPGRQAGDGRQGLPVEVVLEHRGLPARRPSSAAVRSLAYPTLFDEDVVRTSRAFSNGGPLILLPPTDRLHAIRSLGQCHKTHPFAG